MTALMSSRRRLDRVILEQLAVSPDHFAGALAVGDDIEQPGAKLGEIRRRAGNPPEAAPRVENDGRQRLADLVGDGGGKLAERRET